MPPEHDYTPLAEAWHGSMFAPASLCHAAQGDAGMSMFEPLKNPWAMVPVPMTRGSILGRPQRRGSFLLLGGPQGPEGHTWCQPFALATHLLSRGRISPQVTGTLILHSPGSPVVDPNAGPLPPPPVRAGGHTEAMRKLMLSQPLGTSHWRARKGPWPREAREPVRDYGLLAWK